MKLALFQYPIVWADRQANLDLLEQHLAALTEKVDVVMLPEMFTTGFCTSRPDLAEPTDGPTMQTVKRLSAEYDCAIVGSFICENMGYLFNRGFFAMPDGNVVYADKRHLYAHGGEAEFFRQGTVRPAITFRGCRFCLLICYDLRFPVWSRNRTGDDYDVLLYVANWPKQRIKFWDALLPARASENQCVVAAVNPVGTDGLGLHYTGHSIVYDTRLDVLAQLPEDTAGVAIADIDVTDIHYFRQHSPLWHDADKYEFV
ncbi:MAG: nitrilase family protein [Paludibacteraceae bacterium]|nr:nitrilase family protein [Paludibacteraceae bacterium]